MNTSYPKHIGFIPDGNRRYAQMTGTSLEKAYEKGSEIALKVVELCQELGVNDVSFYGTSANNLLKRPREEIIALQSGVVHFCRHLTASHVHYHLLGNPSHAVIDAYAALFEKSVENDSSFLVHIDASGPDNINDELRPLIEAIDKKGMETVRKNPAAFVRSAKVPLIDLVIRTGERKHLSNFLPWQCGEAELCFLPVLWPNFTLSDFGKVLGWLSNQERMMGR